MSRRDNGHLRCGRCAMLGSLCICAEMPELQSTSRLCLVLHRDEARKPTNTGQLAASCLSGSEVLVHGREGERVVAPWDEGEDPFVNVLLFPCDESEILSETHLAAGPVRLVVPDGTWRQASKMTKRIPWMASLPRVGLPDGAESQYRLRAEPKKGGLATMEAIARAFGVLEGQETQQKLEEVFRKMTDRTLFSRGRLAKAKVFGGLPDSVQQHKPGGNAD